MNKAHKRVSELNLEIEAMLSEECPDQGRLQHLFQRSVALSKELDAAVTTLIKHKCPTIETSQLLLLQSQMLRGVSKLNRQILASSRRTIHLSLSN